MQSWQGSLVRTKRIIGNNFHPLTCLFGCSTRGNSRNRQDGFRSFWRYKFYETLSSWLLSLLTDSFHQIFCSCVYSLSLSLFVVLTGKQVAWRTARFFPHECLNLCIFVLLEVEAEPARQLGERPSKRRCFWEYRRARESATKKKLGGDVHWSLSWSSSTLPSTLYRREGENTALLRDASECYLMLIVSYKK